MLFLPSASDEHKNHPSRHGTIALHVPEVPKMFVEALCLCSFGSNGGYWVVLVPTHPFLEKAFFFHAPLSPKKVFVRNITTNAKRNRFMLFFMKSRYAFLLLGRPKLGGLKHPWTPCGTVASQLNGCGRRSKEYLMRGCALLLYPAACRRSWASRCKWLYV